VIPAADRELVELLSDRPDLLAVADAIAATQTPPRRALPRRGALAAVAVAAIALLALASPWSGNNPVTLERALAALGSGDVLHVVVEFREDDLLVELGSGRERPRLHRSEWWWDAEREAFRSRSWVDDVRTEDQVLAAGRFCSTGGCVDAGETTAQPEPAVAAFASEYAQALATGAARVGGRATVRGRAAQLLEFRRPSGEVTTVAVDAATGVPLEFRSRYPGGRRSPVFEVRRAELVARDERLFAPPPRSGPRVTAGEVGEAERVTIPAAEAALGTSLLWLGADGLDRVERSEVTVTLTDGREQRGAVIRLVYGATRVSLARGGAGAATLGLSLGTEPPPPAGTAVVRRGWGRHDPWTAQLLRGPVAVSISAATKAEVLAAARALRPHAA
jgi:hypothetical protein